jgi:hypothetical protein
MTKLKLEKVGQKVEEKVRKRLNWLQDIENDLQEPDQTDKQ